MGHYGILKNHYDMAYMLVLSLRCDGYSKEPLIWPLEPHKWKSVLKMTLNGNFHFFLPYIFYEVNVSSISSKNLVYMAALPELQQGTAAG